MTTSSSAASATSADATYEPAAFAADGRAAAIRRAAPTIDATFAAAAEAGRHVGHVWGVVTDEGLAHVGRYGVCDLDSNLPVDEHTRYHIASLTKSLTCMAVLKLRDAGRLSLRDPIVEHVPELARSTVLTGDAIPITVEHLMTMTSGLPEDNPWADRQLDDSESELLELLDGGLSFSSVPGSAYEYSNLGYALLGLVITRTSGELYQDYVTREILEPLGMLDTVFEYDAVPEGKLAVGYRWVEGQYEREPMLHTGAYASIGGLITTLDDFARYVAFHLSAWPPRSAPDDGPVRRSTVREMHAPARTRLAPNARDAAGEPCPTMTGYAYGLGVRTDCRGTVRVSHTGGLPGFGTNVQFYPHRGIGLISFANLTYARSSRQMDAATAALFDGGDVVPRRIAVNPHLAARAAQVAELVQTWDPTLAAEILAENVDLDRPLDRRRREAEAIFAEVGAIRSVGDIEPQNQLRGTFTMVAERGAVDVFFTMSPERPARVQRIDLRRRDG